MSKTKAQLIAELQDVYDCNNNLLECMRKMKAEYKALEENHDLTRQTLCEYIGQVRELREERDNFKNRLAGQEVPNVLH